MVAPNVGRAHEVRSGVSNVAMMSRFDPVDEPRSAPSPGLRRRAAINDEGAIALLVLTAAAALASLASVLAELGHSPSLYQILLGIATILLSWTFMHTMFALHYAHEFYDRGRTTGSAASFFLATKTRTIGTFSIIHWSWR